MRYLGIEVDDALELSEHLEIRRRAYSGRRDRREPASGRPRRPQRVDFGRWRRRGKRNFATDLAMSTSRSDPNVSCCCIAVMGRQFDMVAFNHEGARFHRFWRHACLVVRT